MAKLDLRFPPIIWQRYQQEAPPNGIEYDQWCQDLADELKITADQIKSVIARQSTIFHASLEEETRTLAQKIAHKRGLNEELVIAKLLEGMDAEREEVLTFQDFEGRIHPLTGEERLYPRKNPLKDENGKWITFKAPDHKARMLAAREAVRVLGMITPEYVLAEVTQKTQVNIINLAPHELEAQLEEVNSKLQRLGAPGPTPKTIDVTGGVAGEEVRGRLPHVADDGHKNGGRAGKGRAESPEGVSGLAVHPTEPRGVRKRADRVSPKK